MSIPNKNSKGEKVFDVANIILMCLLGIAFIYPVLNVLAISLSGSSPILRGEVTFFPKQLTMSGYKDVFTNKYIWMSYGNSIFVAGMGCILGLVMVSLAAYPMAFGDFYGKKIYNYMILFTMWFSGGLIPTYLVMSKLNLVGSHWALIFNLLAPPYYIIILRSFFASIPESLIESAKLDGANDLVCMIKIVLPLSKPVLATISLWFIVAHWNNFLGPLMYLNERTKYTLQVILNDIVLQASGNLYEISDAVQSGDGVMVVPQQVQNAVIFVSMVPMLIIYPFVQKYFVKGVMIGSVKG
ncbi:MAG: carbohydrate ABC transporter permease [Epulopiscium sp.]|nr:carbohydrate ABC transporter permease [Candidatus Epulonipiscium sp.]